jgi:hypothetical protein
MRKVEFFNFMLPPSAWSKKPYPSRFKMTIEDAAKRHPGAPPILSTRQVRNIPETPAELSAGTGSTPPMPGSAAWKELHLDN